MYWNYYNLFWICIIGLCLGSFYNVVILRSLSNESIVFPPSKCPKCGHKLYFWHNIPVISYLLLGGKCFFCKEKISIQYPIIELLTMLIFGLVYNKFGMSVTMFFILCWVSGLIIMTTTDIKEKIVDCNIAIIMGVLGIIYHYIMTGWNGVISSILGLIACALVVELFARFGYLVAKTRAMGEGDTYVAGALGAIFCINGAIPVLLYSFVASLVFIVPMFLYNKFKQGNHVICLLSLLFILCIVLYENYPNMYAFSSLAISGIILAISILRSIDTKNSMSYFPFVPALTVGAIICIWTLL